MDKNNRPRSNRFLAQGFYLFARIHFANVDRNARGFPVEVAQEFGQDTANSRADHADDERSRIALSHLRRFSHGLINSFENPRRSRQEDFPGGSQPDTPVVRSTSCVPSSSSSCMI